MSRLGAAGAVAQLVADVPLLSVEVIRNKQSVNLSVSSTKLSSMHENLRKM